MQWTSQALHMTSHNLGEGAPAPCLCGACVSSCELTVQYAGLEKRQPKLKEDELRNLDQLARVRAGSVSTFPHPCAHPSISSLPVSHSCHR